jgi:hypothetical protein
MDKNTTQVVDAIGSIRFEGNTIPHTWYQQIKMPSGKTDINAIILLADVVYWYRPTIQRDEDTNEIIKVSKKFKADMLQKQYESWGGFFGLTKRQTKDAVDRLVESGLLRREFRNIKSKTGLALSNVMFIEPVPEKVKELTQPVQTQSPTADVTHPPKKRNTPPEKTEEGLTKKRNTYTEITTEITTDNQSSSDIPKVAPTQNLDSEEASNDKATAVDDDKSGKNAEVGDTCNADDNTKEGDKPLKSRSLTDTDKIPVDKERPTTDNQAGKTAGEKETEPQEASGEKVNVPPPAPIKVIDDYVFRKIHRMLSPADWTTVKALLEEDKVPVATIMLGIDNTVTNFKPKHKGDSIRSFKFFVPEIQRLHAEKEWSKKDKERIKTQSDAVIERCKAILGGK